MTAPGQADEYTPNEYEVGAAWCNANNDEAEFDRFLAARDRAVREATLEEAAQIAERHAHRESIHGTEYGKNKSQRIATDIRRAAANPFASSGNTTNGDKTK